ncbi:MAG: N-acetyl-D-Glu racemase DgcA [Kordiimonas sp.]
MRLSIKKETWPLKAGFAISRAALTHSYIITVEITVGAHTGRGECEAHESDVSYLEVVAKEIESVRPFLKEGFARRDLATLLPAGPARNALDCALWDLEAKQSGERIWDVVQISMPSAFATAFTIGVDTPENMAGVASENADKSLLKLKLGAGDNLSRVRAVRSAAPQARMIVDANEAFSFPELVQFADACTEYGVELIEQPLPKDADDELVAYRGDIPLCADESCTNRRSLPSLLAKYAYINIKLDKTGGLTEALALAEAAKRCEMGVMVGCMVGTSLAMAPAMVVATFADFVDLDGPLLLGNDRSSALQYDGDQICLPAKELWG